MFELCGVGSEAKEETYEYPIVTLLPYVETPPEQPHVAELTDWSSCSMGTLFRASSSPATREPGVRRSAGI